VCHISRMSKVDKSDQLALELVTETFKLIDGQGGVASTQVAVNFLARFAGTLVYRSLKQQAPTTCKTPEEMVQFTGRNFAGMKVCVQEAISAAFSGAMKTYAGQDIEYYCQVKPVPEPLNKEPI